MATNNFAYIEKTMPGVIDSVFAQKSLTDALMDGSEVKLDFLDAKTVKITKLSSTGLTSYARGGHGGTNANGAAQSSHEVFTLSQERYSAIPVDKLDALDDAETVFGHLATEFARTKVVQEFDTYRFGKLASYTSATLGNRVIVSESALENKIIAEFNKALEWMSDNKVPEEDTIIYVSPKVMTLIRNTTELYKKLSQSEYAGKVSFAIQNYENKPIVVVPSDEFYTDVVTGDGYYPSSTSKKINFMFVNKKAPIIVKKLDWTKVYSSDEVKLGYVGYSFENLFYHDLFVSDNKVVGIYACVSTTDAKASANALLADIQAASSQGKSIASRILTAPAGIIFDKVGLTTSDTAPAIGSAYNDATVASVGDNGEVTYNEFTPNASHNILVASYEGKVVAVSKDYTTTLPVGE